MVSVEDSNGKEYGCALCNSERVTIVVETEEPKDGYYFSSDSEVGLMYCPLCGRYINE